MWSAEGADKRRGREFIHNVEHDLVSASVRGKNEIEETVAGRQCHA